MNGLQNWENHWRRHAAYLRNKCTNPDSNEDGVAIETLEDISLSVNLARVDFVEQRHHDERVENDGEVLRGSADLPSAVNVQQ